MSEFTLDVQEVADYARRMNEISNAGARAFGKVATKWRDEAIKIAKERVPQRPTPAGQVYQRTGNLKRSIKPTRTKASRGALEAGIEVGMFYAGFVEFGTSKMAPQPYIRPALRKIRRPYRDELERTAVDLLSIKGRRLTGRRFGLGEQLERGQFRP